MKLLIDHNLSHKILRHLSGKFESSVRVKDFGMEKADDAAIWDYAKATSFTILSQDADFYDIGFLKGYPPKIIWIRSGNASTNPIISLLDSNHLSIRHFIENADNFCLEIF